MRREYFCKKKQYNIKVDLSKEVGRIEKLVDDESFQKLKFQIKIYVKALVLFDIGNGYKEINKAI